MKPKPDESRRMMGARCTHCFRCEGHLNHNSDKDWEPETCQQQGGEWINGLKNDFSFGFEKFKNLCSQIVKNYLYKILRIKDCRRKRFMEMKKPLQRLPWSSCRKEGYRNDDCDRTLWITPSCLKSQAADASRYLLVGFSESYCSREIPTKNVINVQHENDKDFWKMNVLKN